METEETKSEQDKPEVDLPRIIDKIRKLFALGQSPNEHEAAAAVAKAQEMLAAYDLTMESVENLKSDSRTSIGTGQSIVQTVEGKTDGWKVGLFEAVAETSDCFTAYQYTYEKTPSGKTRSVKHGNLIGFRHDVEMAGYALAYLIAEIERLAQAYADEMWAEIRVVERTNGWTHQQAESHYVQETGRHPLKAKLYFTRGAAESVVRKLKLDHYERQEAATRANPHALVLMKRQAVEDAIWKEKYGYTRAERDAKWAEADARRQAELAAKPPVPEPEPVVQLGKPETDAQRRRREEREERANERYWQKEDNARRRKEAAMDRTAYREGKDTGATIGIRPGITDGPKRKGSIG